MKKEIIKKIEKIFNVIGYDDLGYEGYLIKTNLQEIKILIRDYQYCCENWGYFWCDDNIEEYINSELYKIEIVDECLKPKRLPSSLAYQGNACFINLETSNGLLQFVLYNSHNGYYSHEVIIRSNHLNRELFL